MKLVHWICCAALLIAGCTGALKKPNLGELYNDVLSDHPELYDTVREVYDTIVLPRRQTLE